MRTNLAEFLDCATFEGTILIKVWDDAAEEYTLERLRDELKPRDIWAYSLPVRYVYPITYYVGRDLVPCVVVEVVKEDRRYA